MEETKEKLVKIIGTHHFMKEREIKKYIEDFNPDIVGIELCKQRVYSIEHPDEQKADFSLLGIIAKAVRRKGKKEGITYGGDMIAAHKIAKQKNLQIELIDRPIIETQALFKSIPFLEKMQFIKQLIKFNSKKIKIQDIINEVDSNEKTKEILEKLKEMCPITFYFLINSRDEYMTNKIKSIMFDNPEKKILIIVGKGHKNKLEKKING